MPVVGYTPHPESGFVLHTTNHQEDKMFRLQLARMFARQAASHASREHGAGVDYELRQMDWTGRGRFETVPLGIRLGKRVIPLPRIFDRTVRNQLDAVHVRFISGASLSLTPSQRFRRMREQRK